MALWHRIINALRNLLAPKVKTPLADLLSSKSGQEELLGVAQLTLPTPAVVLQDMNAVINYSQSTDYKIWVQEVWSKVIFDLEKILDPKASRESIDFYRGRVSQALALLRVSYQVKMKEPVMRKQASIPTSGAKPMNRAS